MESDFRWTVLGLFLMQNPSYIFKLLQLLSSCIFMWCFCNWSCCGFLDMFSRSVTSFVLYLWSFNLLSRYWVVEPLVAIITRNFINDVCCFILLFWFFKCVKSCLCICVACILTFGYFCSSSTLFCDILFFVTYKFLKYILIYSLITYMYLKCCPNFGKFIDITEETCKWSSKTSVEYNLTTSTIFQ